MQLGVNQMLLQPFVNYNFPDAPGRYLSFSPIVTADWKADSGQQWTVPLGLSIGQIAKIGGQPLNLQAGAYYNVQHPDDGARWQIRFLVEPRTVGDARAPVTAVTVRSQVNFSQQHPVRVGAPSPNVAARPAVRTLPFD